MIHHQDTKTPRETGKKEQIPGKSLNLTYVLTWCLGVLVVKKDVPLC